MTNCAFLIGCIEYRSKAFERYDEIKHDIINMKNAMIEYCNCSKEDIYIIADTDEAIAHPTGYEICNSIADTSTTYNGEELENLYIYYSGHGYISSKDEAVLVPTDTFLDPIEQGTLPLFKIIELIKECFKSVEHIIVILDMCLTIKPYAKMATKANRQINTDNHPSKGVIIYYSCYPRKSSYIIPPSLKEELGQGSVFTNVFIDALEDRDHFTAEEIEKFAVKRIHYYNDRTSNFQKPFAAYLEPGLQNVVIKYKTPDGITKVEFQEFQHANTMDMQFEETEIKMILDFSRTISLEPTSVSEFSSNTIKKVIKLDETVRKYKNVLPIKQYNTLLNDVYRIFEDIEYQCEISKGYKFSHSIPETIIDKTELLLRACWLQYKKDCNLLEDYKREADMFRKELSEYCIAATIFINRNPKTDTSLLKSKISTYPEYFALLQQTVDAIKEKIKIRTLLIKNLDTYSVIIHNVSTYLYNDKNAYYFHTRYNSDAIHDLQKVIEEVYRMSRADF